MAHRKLHVSRLHEEVLVEQAAAGEEAHFVCDDCMSGDVQHRQSGLITVEDQQIKCCMTPQGCKSPPFAYQDVARHCTAEAFQGFQQQLAKIQETVLEREVEVRVKEAQEAMLAKSAVELETLIARKHIEEEMKAGAGALVISIMQTINRFSTN